MGSAVPEGAARAAEALQRATTVPDLLRTTCAVLAEMLHGQASVISRVLGDVLVPLSEFAPGGESLQLGQGFLIPDFPLTQEVIRRGESRRVSLHDDEPDPQELALLEAFGFDELLMVPLAVAGQCWALVEVYRRDGPPFTLEDAGLAEHLVGRAGELVERLS